MFAGVAGVLYTYNVGSIQPSSFTVIQSAYYLVYVAVGGASMPLGQSWRFGSQHSFRIPETHQGI